MQSAVASEELNMAANARLTPEQERQLAMDFARGDEETVAKLIKALVVSVVKNYKGGPVPLEDLVQEGSEALLEAARSFDHTKGFRFSTYAKTVIRNRINHYLRSQKSLIRLPDDFQFKMQPIFAAMAAFQQENGREPALQELAPLVNMDECELRELMQRWPQISSLDATLSGEESTLQAYLEDQRSPKPYQPLVREELRRLMEELLSRLDERQRQALRLHFGMEDGTCHTFEEIGDILGVSRQRAQQITTKAMEHLRCMSIDVGLEDFLN